MKRMGLGSRRISWSDPVAFLTFTVQGSDLSELCHRYHMVSRCHDVSQICQDVSCVTTYHDVSGCFKTCPDASRCVSCCVRMFHNVSQCEMKVTELTSDARTWCQSWGDHNGLETSCSFDSIKRTTPTEWGDLLVYVPLRMELVQRARNFPQTGCVCRYRSYHQTYIEVVEPWTNDFSSTEWVLAEQRMEQNCVGSCGQARGNVGRKSSCSRTRINTFEDNDGSLM